MDMWKLGWDENAEDQTEEMINELEDSSLEIIQSEEEKEQKKSEDREWNNILKVLKELMKERKLPIKNSVFGKVVLQNWRRYRDIIKQKLKEFITTKPALQEMLKEFFKLKWKDAN